MLRDERSHFLPESITDLPLVAHHTSPSEIIIMYYLTIPFGIGSYNASNTNIPVALLTPDTDALPINVALTGIV